MQAVKNPTLKLLLAWRCRDAATYGPMLKAEVLAERPRSWVLMLISHLHGRDQPELALRSLVRLRSVTSQPAKLQSIDSAILGTFQATGKSTSELPADILTICRGSALALRRTAATASRSDIDTLVTLLEKLELAPEAERLRKLSPKTSSRVSSTITRSSADPSKLGNDLDNEMTRAGAIQRTAAALRSAVNSLADPNNSNRSYERKSWHYPLSRNADATKQIWEQLTQNIPTTYKERLHRATLADIFGKSDVAIPLFEECLKVQPKDGDLLFRLAMLHAKQPKGQDKALDYLLRAKPSELSSIGRYWSRDISDMKVRDRFAYAQLFTAFVSKVTSKAPSEELGWVRATTDVLLSCSEPNNGATMPSLLQIDLPKDRKPAPEELQRLQLWEAWTTQAVKVPSLALHTLPAMIALAKHQGRSITPLMEQAELALAGLAAERGGSYNYITSNWVVTYSGSYTSPMLPTYHVLGLLLDQALETKTYPTFTKDTLPLVRLAYGDQMGTLLERTGGLYTCPPEKFKEAAKAYESMQRAENGNRYNPLAVLQAATKRQLSKEGLALVIDYIQDRIAKGNGLENAVITTFAKSQLKASRTELRTIFESLIGACLGQPSAKWQSYIEQHASSGGLGSSHLIRIQAAADALYEFTSVHRPSQPIALLAALQAGLMAEKRITYLIRNCAPTNAVDAEAWLEAMAAVPCFADSDTFDPIPLTSERSNSVHSTSLYAMKAANKKVLETLRKALPKRSGLGFKLLEAALAQKLPPVQEHLRSFDAAAGSLPAEQRERVIDGIRNVWSNFDAEARKADVAKALPNLTKGLRSAAEKTVSDFIAAKTVRDVSSDDTSFVKRVRGLAEDLLLSDTRKAEQLLAHAFKLINEAQARDDWRAGTYANGFNSQSDILHEVCIAHRDRIAQTDHPSAIVLAPLRLAAALATSSAQSAIILPDLSSNDSAGKGGLHRIWMANSGWAKPRPATAALVQRMAKAVQDAPSLGLVLPCHEFAKQLTPWYRQIVREEATLLSTQLTNPIEQAMARELALGIGLLEQDPAALQSLRARFDDESLSMTLRAKFASVLCLQWPDVLPTDLAECMKLLSALNTERHPGYSSIWSGVLQAFNRQPESSEWKAIATTFCKAWIARAELNTKGEKLAFKGLRPSGTTCLHALETFARLGDAALLQSFAKLHIDTYDNEASARLILARHQRGEELASLMAINDGSALNLDRSTHAGISFGDSDKLAMEVAANTITFKPLALLAQAQIASIRDAPGTSAELRQTPRLKKIAEQLLTIQSMSPLMRSAVEKICLESLDAARVLASAWMKENDVTEQLKTALDGSERREQVRLIALYTVARLIDGDDAPWKAVMALLRERRSSESYRLQLNDVAYWMALATVWHQREHGYEGLAWLPRLLDDYTTLLPDDVSKDKVSADLHHMFFAHSLVVDGGKGHAAWLAKQSNTNRKVLEDQDSTWVMWALDSMPMIKGEDGVRTLLTGLKQPIGVRVLTASKSLSYKDRPVKRFTEASLREHTAELLALKVDRRAVFESLMNAWAKEKDLTPLVKALDGFEGTNFQKALIQCIRDEAKHRAR
jgi:hypothetical protein